MAKAKIDKAAYDSLPEPLQAEYSLDGDSYVLKVDGVDGLELADVSGMRGVIGKNGKAIKALQNTLGNYGEVQINDKGEVAFEPKFTPESFEELTTKHAELEKSLDGTDLEKTAAQRAEQLLREQLPAKIKPLETAKKELEEDLTKWKGEALGLKKRMAIDHTLLERGYTNPALGQLLNSQARTDDEGKIYFADDQGQPIYAKDSDSNNMAYAPASEILDTWKTKDHLKPLFPSEAKGGGGSQGQGSRGNGSGDGGVVTDTRARLI